MNRLLPFITLLSLFLVPVAPAQNLIRNGSFEEHAPQTCLNCNIAYGKYPGMVYHWDNADWGCILCDKDYKRNSDEIRANYCPLDKVLPYEGKAMIQMQYRPQVGGNIHEGADYLRAKTTQSMEVGQLYEISFWINIESKKRSDPDWASHIGIALLPQNLKMHGLYDTELILPFLKIDTVIYDAWYQVKWRVRPLCTSNYLMIGVFEDHQWHQNSSYVEVNYFIDKVSVTEMPSVSAVSDSSIYYCSRYDPISLGVPPQMDNQTLLFQNDAFALSEAHKTVLDSFVVFARKYPDLVFEISGHTDSIGTQNQQLSENRAQSVLQYLTETHKLPAFRFILLAMSSKEPFRPNRTEEGRILNRRAEIRQSRLDLANIFYREALKAVETKRYSEGFSCLNKWLIKLNQGHGSGIIMQFDPRFEVLHKDNRWNMLDQRIRNKYSNLNIRATPLYWTPYAWMISVLLAHSPRWVIKRASIPCQATIRNWTLRLMKCRRCQRKSSKKNAHCISWHCEQSLKKRAGPKNLNLGIVPVDRLLLFCSTQKKSQNICTGFPRSKNPVKKAKHPG